jgi:hypothetical protein
MPLSPGTEIGRGIEERKRLAAPNQPISSLLPASTLATLLVLERHERARGGDARGAVERYLDAIRFGGDLREGAFIQNMIGIAVADVGH